MVPSNTDGQLRRILLNQRDIIDRLGRLEAILTPQPWEDAVSHQEQVYDNEWTDELESQMLEQRITGEGGC